MATRVRSYSKINLGLAIGPVRPDGFHELVTLYQTLALRDYVTVEARLTPGSRFEVRGSRESGDRAGGQPDPDHPTSGRSRITLTTNNPQVPADERNTAWKMVALALERLGMTAEVAIHIEKQLPVQGGLGAGSANAAAALIGLERELRKVVPDRLKLAAEVGSDVPLFLVGGTVLGTGRGEQVAAVADLEPAWCTVALPDVQVSTPRAFQEWDGLCAARNSGRVATPTSQNRDVGHPGGLTSAVRPDRLKELSHVYATVFGTGEAGSGAETFDPSGIVRGSQGEASPERQQGAGEGETSARGGTRDDLAESPLLALVRTGIENDFEEVVFSQVPFLREIKRLLMGTAAGGEDRPGGDGGALYAALSGSGSALFGLYRTDAESRAAQQRVLAAGCKAVLTGTLPRPDYWGTMFAEQAGGRSEAGR